MTRLHCRGAILRRSPGDRKYHRTQRMTITSSKCRPRNSTGRFWLTVLPYQKPPVPFATDPVRELRRYLREAVAAAGITARIVPHQFRHTYAIEMLRAGVTLPSLMKLLGHSSADMTMR